ncbi:hypothetical protein [Desulfolithobacter sp.]
MKLKCFLTKIYIIFFMGLVVFFMVLIWNLTFAHLIHEYHARKEIQEGLTHKEKKKKDDNFEQIILKSEKRVKNYLGYRVLEQQYIEGHFHHIGLDIAPDRHSYCSSCHGDMPHDAVNKDIRAFLNMHAFFVGCQTCHVKQTPEQATGIYKWYDRDTGAIVDSPVTGASPGTYGAKIIPFIRENGKLVRIDTQDKIDFVNEYRKMEKSLSEGQKSKAKKIIHKGIDKKPVMCQECHRKENPLLPLAALGYPKERIDSITSTEVVGMIKNYTKFYMPKMLHPGESTTAPAQDQARQSPEGFPADKTGQ